MKLRLAKIILTLPLLFIDGISTPFAIVNWIFTGNFFDSYTQQLWEQNNQNK